MVHDKTKGKLQYVGEWHSHPNKEASPSATDIHAMKNIALNIQINTKQPILMIAEVRNVLFCINFFIYKKNKLIKYERKDQS